MEKAEVISVIKTKSTRGDGTSANPSRIVIQYWSFDGTLLFEEDPQKHTHIPCSSDGASYKRGHSMMCPSTEDRDC